MALTRALPHHPSLLPEVRGRLVGGTRKGKFEGGERMGRQQQVEAVGVVECVKEVSFFFFDFYTANNNCFWYFFHDYSLTNFTQ